MNQGHILLVLGLQLSLLSLQAQNINPTDRPSPRRTAAPAKQSSLLRSLVENLSAVTSLEATYDLTTQPAGVEARYERRQIIADFVSGKYLIRSLHFRDPERRMGTGCSIESWDGKQYVRLTSGLRNGSFQDLAEGKSPPLGSVVVNSSSGAWDPVLISHLDLFGSRSLLDTIKGAIEAGDYQFTDTQKLKVGSYEIEFLPNGNPGTIKMYAESGNRPEAQREIVMGDYREVEKKQIPANLEVRLRSNDRQKDEWREVLQARLDPSTIKLNAPLDDTAAFRFKLPPGAIVQDNVKNVSYTVLDDPEEYSGKDLKIDAPLGLADMVKDKQIWAKSLLGQRGPEVVVKEWLTSTPDLEGKFVLIDLWATWCGPCRKSIPGLNEIQEKFKDKLTVVGITDENEEKVRAMKVPAIKYAVGIDPENRIAKAVAVTGIPHVILMDPQGIVRWEGFPLLKGQELTHQVVAEIIGKYGDE